MMVYLVALNCKGMLVLKAHGPESHRLELKWNIEPNALRVLPVAG